MNNNFYVYGWYNTDTDEIFYIGKGSGNRYKNITQRNKKFLDYTHTNNVDVTILMDNLSEEDAFYYEKILTDEYKKQGQCFCNLADAGKGGCHFVWTEEFKEYWSKNNPMKTAEQRQRMHLQNPMYNKEIALKNGAKHKTTIKIGNKCYDGLIDAAIAYNRSSSTISDWLRRGKNPLGEACEYLNKKENKKTRAGVEVIIDGILYPTLASAARAINVAPNNLRNALKANRKCKGHECKYANQQPSQ